mmetsp:Transcript_37223/g.107490  ORF Transcript_37223/g.107490 Transcript_37223/m.107490 type:complete len:196 (-) Transcript_37223:117-704(-)
MTAEVLGDLETAAEVGCLESIGLAACCGALCSCCCGDGSVEEVAEFGCLTCCIECLGLAACCRLCCDTCCCCCPCCRPKRSAAHEGYDPLPAPEQMTMGGPTMHFGQAPHTQPFQQQQQQQQPPVYVAQAFQQQPEWAPQQQYGGPMQIGGTQQYGQSMYGQQVGGGGGVGQLLAAGLAGASLGALVEGAVSEGF